MKIKTNYINQKYTLCDFTAINFKGERGDSTPRMAAPQAAALTTWRRPPCINESTKLKCIFLQFFILIKEFELFDKEINLFL